MTIGHFIDTLHHGSIDICEGERPQLSWHYQLVLIDSFSFFSFSSSSFFRSGIVRLFVLLHLWNIIHGQNAIRRQSTGNALHRNSLPSAINNVPSSAPSSSSASPPRIHFTFSPPDSPTEKSASNSSSPDSLTRHFAALSNEEIAQLAKSTPQEIAESIDRKARIVFPFFFFLFNLIYWTCYI